MNNYLLGFDIGGTKCAVILGETTLEGVTILDRIAFPTEASRGPQPALNQFEKIARQITQVHGVPLDGIKAVGISCGNPLDSVRGIIQSPPNLPGWDNIPIVDWVREHLGVPARLQNDANACALAEWRWGAGRGSRHMIFLTFGTGFGAGLILDGRLYAGANDFAGEVGHVRLTRGGPLGYGKRGSYEGYCSGGGISRLAQQIIRKHWVRGETVACCAGEVELAGMTAKSLADAARAGDPVAVEIYTVVGRALGRSLAMLMDLFNPEVIVIGSIFARAQDLLWPAAQKVIAREALPMTAGACRVVPAALGEAIGDYASLSVAAGE
ncbi:MAG: ROK family protein [Armatimonadota bacterium]